MFRFYDSTQRKPTSDRRLNPGPAITIGDDLIPASDRAHQIRVGRRPSFKSNDIAFQKAAALCRFQFWVVYITNTGLRRLRHDFPIFTDKLGSINCGRQVQLGYSKIFMWLLVRATTLHGLTSFPTTHEMS